MRKWLVIIGGLIAAGAHGESFNLNHSYTLYTEKESVRFNPARDHDLNRLKTEISKIIATSNDETKKAQRGWEEIEHLTKKALAQPVPLEREKILKDLVETVLAVNNLRRPVVLAHFDAIMLPVALRQFSRPIGIGRKPAINLQPGISRDLSQWDPLPSSFWSRPSDIATEDLFTGFGRSNPLLLSNQLCHYAAPKETTGMNPGFEVDCDGQPVKLKFGEMSSEPMVTRMFWALGFHADPTDYSPGVRMAYDRKIFTQFNSRRAVRTRFTVLWFIPVYIMNLQHSKDPFAYVAEAVLRDGGKWTGAELKQHLMNGTNFDPAVESRISYLVTTPANVQVKDSQVKSIGPWDYGQLDHAGLREVRGAGLLAAWLGFFDTRFDNTKLRLVGPKKNRHLEHYFSDLGGGLGATAGFVSWHGEDVQAFPWTFTASPELPAKGHPGRPLRIVGYTPVVPTAAFEKMTIDDARWMARLIGQLQPAQIDAALRASGYDAATSGLYLQKLISRRNKMMMDLNLSGEFPPLPEVVGPTGFEPVTKRL